MLRFGVAALLERVVLALPTRLADALLRRAARVRRLLGGRLAPQRAGLLLAPATGATEKSRFE